MSYEEIIKENCKNCKRHWWPKFAYHFTDVSNVVSILTTGYLYSRVKAKEYQLMQNDNASRQVINMTDSGSISKVRFYFRPLTPTQYYTEGFKHAALRYEDDSYANVPVPIFFLFRLEKMLKMKDMCFSEKAQAGHGGPIYQGEEQFRQLDFSKIYSDGYCDKETRQFRHAELLYPNAFPINSCLEIILCRNEIEKSTLLNLLKIEAPKCFYEYKDKIKVCKENLFENNGLFVTGFTYQQASFSFSFSDTFAKHSYEKARLEEKKITCLDTIKGEVRFEWFRNNSSLHKTSSMVELTNDIKFLTFNNIPFIPNAKVLRVELLFEDKLICFVEQNIENIELL